MRRMIASVALLSVLVPVTGTADPIGPTPAAFVVVGDEVIDGGTHVWNMPVVVTPGSSLTIRNATVFVDWRPPVCTHGTAGVCPNPILVNGGTLRIHDSTIDTHVWDVTDGFSGWGVTGTAATLDLQRSTFIHYEGIATQGAGSARSIVRDNTMTWATSAIILWRGAEADIIDNDISHALYGVTIRDTNALVEGNHLHEVFRNFTGFGRGIDIQSTIVGQRLFTTTPVVRNNIIENGVQGILSLNGFPNTFSGNIIRGNDVGATIGIPVGENIAASDWSVWEGNEFDGNEIQANVYVSGAPTDPVQSEFAIHGNSLIGDSCIDVLQNETQPTVLLSINANDNWWGSPDGPRQPRSGCDRLVGDAITVTSWLTSAP
jgi:hypothetical protein